MERRELRCPRGWYAVELSARLRPGKPLALRCFGVDWVAWRTPAGQLVVLEDRCPHRLARLSLGALTPDGASIACPFHGFTFDAAGACTHVPELGRGTPGMCVRTLVAREAHGFIWLWWGPAGEPADSELPWFADLADDAGYRRFVLEEAWPTHYTRSIENQLDYAHLPYVHRTSIGRFVREPMLVDMELDERRIFWSTRRAEGGPPRSFIEMHLPNVWQNRIAPDFALSLAFVPVDFDHTRLLLTSHLRSTAARLPGIGRIVGTMTTWLNRWILGQDRAVVLSQQPINSLEASDEVLVGSDRAIRHFRRHVQSTGLTLAEVAPSRRPERTDDGA